MTKLQQSADAEADEHDLIYMPNPALVTKGQSVLSEKTVMRFLQITLGLKVVDFSEIVSLK